MAWRHFRPRAALIAVGGRVGSHHSNGVAPPLARKWERRSPRGGILSRFRFSSFHDSLSMVVGDRLNIRNLYISQRCCFSTDAWIEVPTKEIVEVPLAQTGEGIAECELLKWFVQEGDQVEEFQRLCEVQSDKATMEITSRYKGKVHQTLYVPGDIIKVGDTIIKIVIEDTQSTSSSDSSDESNITSSEIDMNCQSPSPNDVNNGKVLSTPPVRALAKQYGLDINEIKGTGQDGRVLKDDVLMCAIKKGVQKESSGISHHGPEIRETSEHLESVDGQHYEDKRVLLRGYQRAMVKSMTMAAKVPHFHYLEEINCNELIELKAAFQRENTDSEIKHTYLPFLIKSLSMALSKYPLLNSSFFEDSNEVVLKGSHNIGVAMATPYGLVVPNIKRVQSLSILDITKELSRLQEMASNNKLSSEEVSGGTMTLSNIGAIGGQVGCPLLNLPEVAIVAMGRIRKIPRFGNDGTVYPAAILNVVVGADHRVVDGATVAKFCNEWKNYVERPELLLLHMK